VFVVVGACSLFGDKALPETNQTEAFREFKEQLALTVEDPQREKESLKIVNGIESDINLLRSDIMERKRRFEQLNADYYATREDFDALFSEVSGKLEFRRKDISSKYRRLQSLLTPSEQTQLNQYRDRFIEIFIESIKTG
jgi:hypothetical protein